MPEIECLDLLRSHLYATKNRKELRMEDSDGMRSCAATDAVAPGKQTRSSS